MSVFGALSSAVSGLAAQARALGNLSGNIANSQTAGYKRVETSFQALVTQPNATTHSSGGVQARPTYANGIQGVITQTESATNMAISGAGFFQVSRGSEGASDIAFQSAPLYTRAGDFSLDRFGYLKNSAGLYLNGWGVNAMGQVDKGSIAPIRVQQLIDTPAATQNISLSANLPLTPPTPNQTPQTVTIIDAVGQEHELQLNWRQQAAGDWRLSIAAPGSSVPPLAGTMPGIDDQTIGPPGITVPGVTPQVQMSRVDIGLVSPGTVYNITWEGISYRYTAKLTDTASDIADHLTDIIMTSSSRPSGVGRTGNQIFLYGGTDTDSFLVTASPAGHADAFLVTPNVVGVKEEVMVPVSGTVGDIGDTYSLTFPTAPPRTITYTTDGEEAGSVDIARRMKDFINADADAPMTAEVQAGGLKLTAKMASSVSVAPTAVATNGTLSPHVRVKFDGGYLSGIDTSRVGLSPVTTAANQNAGDAAYVQFQIDYGYGPQTIKLNLGQFGESGGLTQFAGDHIETTSQIQDGFTRGTFRNLEIRPSGDVVANYDNGRSRVLARVPIIQVTDPNAMQRVDGNAFGLTREAGGARAEDVGANGAGELMVSSIEGSNVDIAQEFTRMIVTQRAYSANTKVVSAVDELLNDLFGMKR